MASVFDAFSNAPAKNAAKMQSTGLLVGQYLGNQAIDKGMAEYKTANTQAQEFLNPYATQYATGSTMYGNAVGLNGPEGNQKALDTFQTGPGYEFAMTQGLDNLDRRQAARGMLGSGNTSAAAVDYSQGVANQEYNAWLNRLQGLDTAGAVVAGQQAGLATDLGGNQYSGAVQKGLIDWNAATGVGNAQSQAEMNRYNVAGNTIGALTAGAKLLGGLN